MAIGTLDAAAPGSTRAPVIVALPDVLITVPVEATLPLKSSIPAIPDAGSTKPVDATSRLLIVTSPWNGVSATSFRLTGPASPRTASVPPPGALASTSNGNGDVNDRFVTFTSTSL